MLFRHIDLSLSRKQPVSAGSSLTTYFDLLGWQSTQFIRLVIYNPGPTRGQPTLSLCKSGTTTNLTMFQIQADGTFNSSWSAPSNHYVEVTGTVDLIFAFGGSPASYILGNTTTQLPRYRFQFAMNGIATANAPLPEKHSPLIELGIMTDAKDLIVLSDYTDDLAFADFN